ncbi:MAG: transposase family protein, partial [Clostridiaceae bacterium]
LFKPLRETEKVMLQTQSIAELLGMEAHEFERIEQDEKQIALSVRMKRRTQECPACRTPCDQVHDYRTQRVYDSPIQGKIVIWQYRKRRYRCRCCGKRFYESNYLLPRRHRIANRLAAYEWALCVCDVSLAQSHH